MPFQAQTPFSEVFATFFATAPKALSHLKEKLQDFTGMPKEDPSRRSYFVSYRPQGVLRSLSTEGRCIPKKPRLNSPNS